MKHPNAAGHKKVPPTPNKSVGGQPHGKWKLLYQHYSNTFTAKKQEPENKSNWTPEQGGHRWKGSRKTLKEPEYEEPTEVKRSYTEDKPPHPPKGYIFVEARSTKYGYLCYKYVLKPPQKARQKKKKE